ncbi:hypothetical protein WIW89_00405 [Stygiolobus sp. CP850M]|uniref:hypothetical protein n=1 Tax=Stygiolobus sp. CP850M TaxID=3133134 RepID=UPI00307ECCA7
MLRVYFQLDEILSFAIEELGGDEIVVEISAVEQTGDFKDGDEMGAYAVLLYISLAYAIHYSLLILVID